MFYTLKEVCNLLNIKPITLRRILKKGDITYYKIGRNIKISEQDLEQYLNNVKSKK